MKRLIELKLKDVVVQIVIPSKKDLILQNSLSRVRCTDTQPEQWSLKYFFEQLQNKDGTALDILNCEDIIDSDMMHHWKYLQENKYKLIDKQWVENFLYSLYYYEIIG